MPLPNDTGHRNECHRHYVTTTKKLSKYKRAIIPESLTRDDLVTINYFAQLSFQVKYLSPSFVVFHKKIF